MVGGRSKIMRCVAERGKVVGGGLGLGIDGTMREMNGSTASWTSELRSDGSSA